MSSAGDGPYSSIRPVNTPIANAIKAKISSSQIKLCMAMPPATAATRMITPRMIQTGLMPGAFSPAGGPLDKPDAAVYLDDDDDVRGMLMLEQTSR